MDRREFGRTIVGAAAVGALASAASAQAQAPAEIKSAARAPGDVQDLTGIYHDPYLRHPYALTLVEGPVGVVTISGVYTEKKYGAIGFIAQGTREGNSITASYTHLNDPARFGGGKISLTVAETDPTVWLAGTIVSEDGSFKAEKVTWIRVRT